ncbi:porin [Serratia fonticola]|uniref:oligogalacturonate-specific porin KdgM family protein n=1 Tax=Serratia fonticola TaxID=47917 RepID=UPI0015770F64|nr:oligogalacturonate-specific porin KdgM family protein [Serratia fonticola]NTY86635.1 porin [Serratia fonticola]NTZ12643.1 porin [Serratia fonticola]
MKANMVLGCTLLTVAFYSSAVTLDFRHEYVEDSKSHRDRILVSHRFANGLGFSVEGKFKSGGNSANKPFSDIVDNGSEYSISYQQNLLAQFSVQPGLEFETTSSKSIYKPYLRAQYNFANGIYLSGRYRYEYVRDTTTWKQDENINRGDVWLGYKWKSLTFETNYVYKKSDQVKYNNNKNDYEYNGRIAWKATANWTPYMEVGNISVYQNRDDRQTRYRLGVQYAF